MSNGYLEATPSREHLFHAPCELAAVREAGPYAFRGDLRINCVPVGFRLTLCRCGASTNKPYCDGTHAKIGFVAT